jgi:AraC-like DNA-binding protein
MVAMSLDVFTKDTSFPFFIHYGYHDTDLYRHTHRDFSELVIVLNGTALHYVDNDSYQIKKGDVFVISNNTSHGYENTSDFRICNIMYRPELLSSETDIRRLSGYHALFVIEPYLSTEHCFQSRLTLQLSDFDETNNIISAMIQEYNHKADGWKTMLTSYFMRLVVFLSRAYSFKSLAEKYDIINIAKSVSYIESHFIDPISIEELAKQTNLSVRHFTRIFRDTYETTPGRYIFTLRMHHACSLLKSSNLTISEIAFQSGFNDSNYFTRRFRTFNGVTPKQFRKLNRNY